MGLGSCPDEDDLPILQLRKWGPSEFPYNPSCFREGFISPTRRLLLLQSYDFEGLLLPLVKGQFVNHKVTTCDSTFYDRHDSSVPTASVSTTNVSSSSQAVELDTGLVHESQPSVSGSTHAFLSDVDSIAWGLIIGCQQEETSFQELLFVSGKHGVVVHAFSQFNESTEAAKSTDASDVGQGMWIEWGPTSNGEFKSCPKESSNSASSKTWMHTFLAEAERLSLGNTVYTKFPKKPSCPKNVVVSFRIFDKNSQLPDFLSPGSPTPYDQANSRTAVADPMNKFMDPIYSSTCGDDNASKSRDTSASNLNRCVKVFSDSSSQLVGFALSSISSMHVGTGYVINESYGGVLVTVARIISWGLKWVYSVKLDRSTKKNPPDWIDFTFSQSFLICLSKSGLISLHGALTGTYIGLLDVVYISSLGFPLSQSPESDDHAINNISQPLWFQNGDVNNKIRFKRLYVFPQSTLLGVMDECGVIYVCLTDDHVPEEKWSSESIPPHPYQPDLGLLTSWQVGGTEIGFPRALCLESKTQSKHGSTMRGSVLNNRHLKSEIKIKSQNHMLSGKPNRLVRKVFLPTSGFSEDDLVCVSSFGITRFIKKHGCEMKLCQVVHTNLQLDSVVKDEMNYRMQGGQTSSRKAVGCTFHGLLYLVTDKGISVVLPSIFIPSKSFPIEAIGYDLANSSSTITCGAGDLMGISGHKRLFSPWKLEVLDRVLLYEGYEVGEKLFFENGWELGLARIRCLQLALDYLDFEQIRNSLEMLVGSNLAVEGIVRVIFAIVYLMLYKVSNNEASSASRLLSLATSYATMVIRKYGLLQLNVTVKPWDVSSNKIVSHPSELADKEHDEGENSKTLNQIAKLLVVIRSLQRQLNQKYKRLGLTQTDNVRSPALVGADLSENDSSVPVVSEIALLDSSSQHKTPENGTILGNAEELALVPVETATGFSSTDFQSLDGALLFADGNAFGGRAFKMENPKDMIARWELNNMDLNTVVKDALLSGRLPLAVLRLHLHRLNNLLPGEETQDSFNDVRVAGRAIAYDLFIKGEVGLAVTTLQKLGENVETALKQLLFGTVRRSLRMVVAEEMKRHMYLGSHEWKILETVGLIERVYPCRSFFSTLATRQEEFKRASDEDASRRIALCLLHPQFKNIHILCGDIDGVVVGSWITVNEHSVTSEVDDDSNHAAYWVAAVAWANTWDQRVIDRVLLDQPLLMGVHLLWESQLEYYVCHNDWLEVTKLLEVIPSYALTSGSLSIRLDDLLPPSSLEYAQEISGYNNYISFLEELDATYITVPGIRVFRFSANRTSSIWLRMLMEQQLAKKYIFLTDYWHGTADMVALLAESGFLTDTHENSTPDGANDNPSNSLLVIDDVSINPETVQALHKVVVRFSAQYNLLNFLDIYLDVHQLATDEDSLSFLLDAAGDNEWAKCLLLLRVKGKEYDASFSNARAVVSRNLIPGSKLTTLETEGIIQVVDDIAEGSGEIAALATLMFAPVPLQECLRSGSVNRQYGSAQCTLENLRPALQRFPTMWKTLVAACFGQGSVGINLPLKSKVSGYSDLLEYLNWREGVFFSSTRDTSILQMIPYWFPKAVRRLIQLYVQGPFRWQTIADFQTDELSILRGIYYTINSSGHAQINALSWEAAVQKHIEEELYASSLQGAEVGFEHHLHRGRALGALNHLLSARVHKLNSNDNHDGGSATPSTAQTNVHSDVQTLLASISESEQSLLSSVIPLSIEHFHNTVLVASCVFLLELCGLSATTLRIDVAALKRILSFYKSGDNNQYRQLSPSGSVFHSSPVKLDMAESLALALADDYRQRGLLSIMQKEEGSIDTSNQPSGALLAVLQHLEKASLPVSSSGVTCGSWLMTGNGNGAQLRSQQKAASQRWQLITTFCKMHGIPLSTKYLAVLARDNDWVGFLSEAQIGKFPFETVIQVALKEFNDPRLKIHILTVLRNMLSRKKGSVSNFDTGKNKSEAIFTKGNLDIPIELFGIIAECEKLEKPGEALLLKAKNLCWSILAMIASCFHDVSLLSCLTVWLEITAARETSAIKVNDIASQIAKTVGAAVEATNSLPASSRTVIFHHNRKKSKRRHIMEPTPVDSLASGTSQHSEVYIVNEGTQGVANEDNKNKPYPEDAKFSTDANSTSNVLSRMVSVLTEQHLFLPLLQAFEIFLPSCSLLPFIRALQAFSQMRLSEASAHLGSFAARIKEEASLSQFNWEEGKFKISWTISTSVSAADAMLLTCPSPYEKRCLLKLLAATDFGDGGSTATRYRYQCRKMEMAEPCLRGDEYPLLEEETFDDAGLLTTLVKNGYWEQARSWAKQLEISGESCWKSATNHVTEMQAEAMVAEWKEFLWDVPEERVALWNHCQTLFIRYSYPAIKAGLFFLKHAELVEKDIPARELHEILLLSLQWLGGMITLSNTGCPLHLLHEIETRIWLLAVEAESHVKSEGDVSFTYTTREPGAGNGSNLIDRTASIARKMDNQLNAARLKSSEKNDRESSQTHMRTVQAVDSIFSSSSGWGNKIKRRAKGIISSRKPSLDAMDKKSDFEPVAVNLRDDSQFLDENFKVDTSPWKWEERVGSAELERAVLSLLDFGQITAAKQLQAKLSPDNVPSEFLLVDAALKLASLSTPNNKVFISTLDNDLQLVIESFNLPTDSHIIDPLKVLESLAMIIVEGSGHGLCNRIISVVKAANVIGLMFLEAFEKQPIELLQLLSLKAQDSFEEASFLVQTHSLPAASIAQILAESFLKGLLAAHRGGYMDSQKDEGPAPLLWRFSDFLKWAKLCPSESEIGHALMKLVITGQEIPHACEVELLILSHHFYKLSACLDGVDVLVTLAATRVEAYVGDGDFSCLARLITGVGNFYALNFILRLLIENGQLDLLLQKYSAAADANSSTAESVRGFRMAVLTSLKQFNPSDFDAFAMVYNHFDMKHETASLLESRARQSSKQWFLRYYKDQNEDLLESMRYFIEAAEVYSSVDAGNKTRNACAQASLVSLQIRMPDTKWLDLSATNARRILVEQSQFQEAIIVAEAYGLNQPTEWALVLWEQMLSPEVIEQFVAEFVAVLPLQPSMLVELARFYRSEMQARGDQSQFSMWLTGGGIPADWAKYLGRSFRCLLKRTGDFRLRIHLALTATGFDDIILACNRVLDKVPENAGPLILRKGHGGAYLPLM